MMATFVSLLPSFFGSFLAVALAYSFKTLVDHLVKNASIMYEDQQSDLQSIKDMTKKIRDLAFQYYKRDWSDVDDQTVEAEIMGAITCCTKLIGFLFKHDNHSKREVYKKFNEFDSTITGDYFGSQKRKADLHRLRDIELNYYTFLHELKLHQRKLRRKYISR